MHMSLFIFFLALVQWCYLTWNWASLFAYKAGISNAHCSCVIAIDRTLLEKSEYSSLNTDHCTIIAWARNFAIRSRSFEVTITRFHRPTGFNTHPSLLQRCTPVLPSQTFCAGHPPDLGAFRAQRSARLFRAQNRILCSLCHWATWRYIIIKLRSACHLKDNTAGLRFRDND